MARARVDPRRTEPAWAARAADAVLWAVLTAAVLVALRDTYISADGLGNAGARGPGADLESEPSPFRAAERGLDASHRALLRAGSGVDRLRWLSALYGAAAIAVFRFALAPRFTASRAAAQLATATLAVSAGFLQMWLSAECHILQMPFAVVAAVALCRYEERPTARRAAAVALAIAAAALAFVSLGLLALPAAVLSLRRSGGDWRWRVFHAALVPALAGVLIAGGLFLGWRASPRTASLAAWAISYSGGSAERLELVYGLQSGAAALATAGVRAAYGAVSSWVDLTPAVAGWRDHQKRVAAPRRLRSRRAPAPAPRPIAARRAATDRGAALPATGPAVRLVLEQLGRPVLPAARARAGGSGGAPAARRPLVAGGARRRPALEHGLGDRALRALSAGGALGGPPA
jgi:hypothetical protein